MNTRRILAAIPLLLAAACATPIEIERETPSAVADLEQFRQIQAVFREQNMGVHVFDFEGQGQVTVREITLDGFPGSDRSPYLRCRFHYQNRTTKPVVQAWVSLDVLDKDGRMVSTQANHIVVPVPMPLARGSYYSDELRTPTCGAHLQEGWSWRIRCIADLETEEVPLDPPAPEPGLIKLREPMQIKDRNWPYYRQQNR